MRQWNRLIRQKADHILFQNTVNKIHFKTAVLRIGFLVPGGSTAMLTGRMKEKYKLRVMSSDHTAVGQLPDTDQFPNRTFSLSLLFIFFKSQSPPVNSITKKRGFHPPQFAPIFLFLSMLRLPCRYLCLWNYPHFHGISNHL